MTGRANGRGGVDDLMEIIYTSPFVPAEWVAAHGARPVRIVPDPERAASLAGPQAGVCPYARAFVGEAVSANARAVVVTTTCDQMRRSAEWIARAAGAPVFLMNVPATWKTQAASGLYLDELRRLGRFIVALGGRAPSDDELRAVMADYDARRAALEELTPRRAWEVVLLDSGGGPPRRDLPRAAEPPPADEPAGPLRPAPPGPDERAGTPVAIVGGPLMRTDSWLFDVIERSGGTVVLDATETGSRTLPAPFDRKRLRRRPLSELARAYFGGIPDVFRRPDDMLYEWLGGELAATGARGVILRRYTWCDMWGAAGERLKEAVDLPVLCLDSAGEAGLPGGEVNRIEAFMEMLR